MTTPMADIADQFRHASADSTESQQIRKAFFGWYNGLPWYEKKLGSEPVRREGTVRLAAFHGAMARFGGEAVRQTLRAGSTGPDVVAWQKVVGVSPTGTMDPATMTATKAWQAAHGLKSDGIVGPATWAAAPTAKVGPLGAVASAAKNAGSAAKTVGLVAGAGLLGLGAAYAATRLAEGKRR